MPVLERAVVALTEVGVVRLVLTELLLLLAVDRRVGLV